MNFWRAITDVLGPQWRDPRKTLLTKGVGVYSLMSIAGDLFCDAHRMGVPCTRTYFTGVLDDFICDIDWSSHGALRGFGGTSGADQALELIRGVQRKSKIKLVPNVK